MYMCLVCGYRGLLRPQYLDGGEPTFVVCDCCGFESGFDDMDQKYSFEDYRQQWLDNDAQWLVPSKRPKDWDLQIQLKNLEG